MKSPLKLLSFIVFLVITTLLSCRKSDFLQLTGDNKKAVEQFFNLPANVDPDVANVANDLKKQDAFLNSLPSFIKKNGTPRWDKVFYKVKNRQAPINARSRVSRDSSNQQGLFLIPLQSTTSNDIKSYITCYKHNDSLYTYRLYNKDSLDAIRPSADSSKQNMLNTMAVFGHFEKTINGKDSIAVNSPAKGYIKSASLKFSEKKSNSSARLMTVPESTCSFEIFITEDYIFVGFYVNGTLRETYVSYTGVLILDLSCLGVGGGGGGVMAEPEVGGSGEGYYWWNYGTGWPYDGNGTMDPNDPLGWQYWWTQAGVTPVGGGGGYTVPVAYVVGQLGLTPEEADWLALPEKSDRAREIRAFLLNENYSELSLNDRKHIAYSHLIDMMADPEYLEMVEDYSASIVAVHPWMIELFKELAIEIGFKVVKKYMPGYGDWQSIQDAIQNGSQGDWLGMLGEILNIVKKKVPVLAVIDATIDAFDFGAHANKAWKSFNKIQRIPNQAFDGIVKTLKNKCGGILEKIQHSTATGQGIIKYNPADAENFFKEIASHLPGTTLHSPSPGKFYFDVGDIRFTFYPTATSTGGPTFSLSSLTTSWEYKFRFE